MRFNARLICAIALLAGTALLLHARSRGESVPERKPLAAIPKTMGGMSATDVEITEEVRDVLGNGEFLDRRYLPQNGIGPDVELFIAYYLSQSAGETPHSPKHCLPGNGLLPLESGRVIVSTSNGESFPVNRYIVGRGDERTLVLYWYRANERIITNEYLVKFYLVADAIRKNRNDGALIRVNTNILPDETAESAQRRLMSVVDPLASILDQYIPR